MEIWVQRVGKRFDVRGSEVGYLVPLILCCFNNLITHINLLFQILYPLGLSSAVKILTNVSFMDHGYPVTLKGLVI
jgi:hypothetical protein